MRVLLVKTSSMGDIIHTLPAISDFKTVFPDAKIDWVVEAPFQSIAKWHPGVDTVFPVYMRQWRKNPIANLFQRPWEPTFRLINEHHYDYLIDAQGLMKSAWIAKHLKAKTKIGYDKACVREKWAARAYDEHHHVPKTLHAVERTRLLFSKAFNYPLENAKLNYGIDVNALPCVPASLPASYTVFLHGTTWQTKHWPEAYWQRLADLANQHGQPVVLPWGNEEERVRAQGIKGTREHVTVLPKLSIPEVSAVLAQAKNVVAVDTGLGHMSAALDVPTVSLYGPTDPIKTGTHGINQTHLSVGTECAPCLKRHCPKNKNSGEPICFETLSPEHVWKVLQGIG